MARQKPSRHRTLVVDDDTALLESMVTLLRSEGHEVQAATTAALALAAVAIWRPHLAKATGRDRVVVCDQAKEDDCAAA